MRCKREIEYYACKVKVFNRKMQIRFLYPTDGTDRNGDKLVGSILYPSYGAIDTREQIPMKHGFINRKPLRCSNVGMIDALFY